MQVPRLLIAIAVSLYVDKETTDHTAWVQTKCPCNSTTRLKFFTKRVISARNFLPPTVNLLSLFDFTDLYWLLIFVPPQAMHGWGCYVVTVSCWPVVCPDVPCQHGLVCSAGKSIAHMLQRRHHMIARYKLSCSEYLKCSWFALIMSRGYTLEWSPTHLGTNPAQCRVTSLTCATPLPQS